MKPSRVQNAYYLSLNDYVPDETMRRKKEELRQAGISFEIYRPGWHTGMQELLKGLGNRSWEREILAEPDTDAGGRPIIVPVQGKRVLGFAGPVEVEKERARILRGDRHRPIVQREGSGEGPFCRTVAVA